MVNNPMFDGCNEFRQDLPELQDSAKNLGQEANVSL
jgi:hypothetical protein